MSCDLTRESQPCMRQTPEVEKGWVWKGVQGRQGARGVVVEAGTSTPIFLEYD